MTRLYSSWRVVRAAFAGHANAPFLRVWPVVVALVVACAGLACHPRSTAKQPALPAPVESTTLGAGDIFHLEVVGEKDLPDEYQVASDGTVDFPYLNGVMVGGLEPQQVAAVVRAGLIEKQILTEPSVIVRVKEYRSKRITLLGQVKNPGSFPYQPGLTLVQAISLAGGVNQIGLADRVRLTRRLREEKSTTVVVDLTAINSGEIEDILLQAGDRIFVEERLF